jgi:YVTN family beta-propeller protein
MSLSRSAAKSFILGSLVCSGHAALAAAPLQLESSIALPNVAGRIDHLAADADGQRVFVAALGNNTVEVVDLAAKKVAHTITGLHEPQGVAYLNGEQLIAVANGGDGSCQLFDARTFEPRESFDFRDDADNLRYDSHGHQLLVGYGSGAIGIIDATTRRKLKEIALTGHPESFQFEKDGPRIFVNVPGAKQIAVIDRVQGKVVHAWPVTDAESNFPLALDEPRHRLFVGCRKPARVLVYDTQNGEQLTQFASVGDADDLFYDSTNARLYVIGGEGLVFVHRQLSDDKFELLAKLTTCPGARTALFSEKTARLFVALPRHASSPAELRVYSIGTSE